MAVKCILTGQTPSVLDGVTENVQSQIDNKVNKVTGKGLSTEDYTTIEKTKLSGIEEGAQKNTVTSVAGKTGAVTLAKGDVGLGNVDNTSDANKPISNATQAALNNKQSKITVNGILKGDGTGAVTAAEETEVELVDLPTAHVSNISLPTASWTGSDPYTQTITIPGSTANTKVDIQPSEEIYDQLVADNVGYLAIKNVDDTLTAVAKGGKPSVNLTVQVTYNNVY